MNGNIGEFGLKQQTLLEARTSEEADSSKLLFPLSRSHHFLSPVDPRTSRKAANSQHSDLRGALLSALLRSGSPAAEGDVQETNRSSIGSVGVTLGWVNAALYPHIWFLVDID